MANAQIKIAIDFVNGSTIEEVLTEAKYFATNLDIGFAVFVYNGVNCAISKNADLADAVKQYTKARATSKGYVLS